MKVIIAAVIATAGILHPIVPAALAHSAAKQRNYTHCKVVAVKVGAALGTTVTTTTYKCGRGIVNITTRESSPEQGSCDPGQIVVNGLCTTKE